MGTTESVTRADDSSRSRSRIAAAMRDGLATYPVGLGVLLVWGVVEWGMAISAIGTVSPALAGVTVVAVGLLGVLGHVLAAARLAERGLLRTERRRVAWRVTAAYVPAAAVLAAVGLEAYVLAVAAGALAMTSPGVHWVVLDGSSPGRALVRVLTAATATALAVPLGYVVGFLAFWVSTIIGSFVLGFLVGHLTTFVPLVLIGPGPGCDARPPRSAGV